MTPVITRSTHTVTLCVITWGTCFLFTMVVIPMSTFHSLHYIISFSFFTKLDRNGALLTLSGRLEYNLLLRVRKLFLYCKSFATGRFGRCFYLVVYLWLFFRVCPLLSLRTQLMSLLGSRSLVSLKKNLHNSSSINLCTVGIFKALNPSFNFIFGFMILMHVFCIFCNFFKLLSFDVLPHTNTE